MDLHRSWRRYSGRSRCTPAATPPPPRPSASLALHSLELAGLLKDAYTPLITPMPLLEVKIPPMGESISSGVLAKWHVRDGDAGQEGPAALRARDRQDHLRGHRRGRRQDFPEGRGRRRGEDRPGRRGDRPDAAARPAGRRLRPRPPRPRRSRRRARSRRAPPPRRVPAVRRIAEETRRRSRRGRRHRQGRPGNQGRHAAAAAEAAPPPASAAAPPARRRRRPASPARARPGARSRPSASSIAERLVAAQHDRRPAHHVQRGGHVRRHGPAGEVPGGLREAETASSSGSCRSS